MACGPQVLERIACFGEEIREELLAAHTYKPVAKDILIVTHDQLSYLQQCVASIREHTEDYQIYVWDNASGPEAQEWLESQPDIISTRSETNQGFIIPNNRLIAQGGNPVVILLNDDTVVRAGWDKAMIGFMQAHDVAQVGYIGGWLDKTGKGKLFGWGGEVDYIPGWCFAIQRKTYEEIGLFDENHLRFAYCEDADFSLRLTETGRRIHALHLDLVIHFENTTIKKVAQNEDCRASFEANHAFMRQRWAERLAVSRCPYLT